MSQAPKPPPPDNSNCPSCNYPHSSGGPYLGLYQDEVECGGCGWLSTIGRRLTWFEIMLRAAFGSTK